MADAVLPVLNAVVLVEQDVGFDPRVHLRHCSGVVVHRHERARNDLRVGELGPAVQPAFRVLARGGRDVGGHFVLS